MPTIRKNSAWSRTNSCGKTASVCFQAVFRSDEKGLSYEEYLKMLFLLQNEQKKYYRTMSAMEIRMIELGNTDFRLKNYIYGAQSRAAFKIGTIPHSYEKTCSYHYG